MAFAVGTLSLTACSHEAAAPGASQERDAVDPFSGRPEFFPLGVFLQSPHKARQWADLGMNMIVPANGYLTLEDIAHLRSLGMVVGGKANDRLPLSESGETLAFFVARDEPDNAQAREDGSWGPCLTAAELADESAELRRIGGGRPVLRNFGMGMVHPEWIGRGSCAGETDGYYPAAIASADIVSFDYYPVFRGEPLEGVAQGARRLRSYIELGGGKQVQWGIIEISAIRGGAKPTPAQIRSMAWMHIANGAKGLIFFPWHVGEKGERIRDDAALADPAVVEGLKALTAEISQFAPILNSGDEIEPTVSSTHAVSALARRFEDDAYLVLVNENSNPADVSIALPGYESGNVVQLPENGAPARPASGFTDTLDSYEPRIYRFRRGD
ncbi:hypothetical protein [Erythrobacter sp.]|uniref:hypothetical protein n=1 Tax=Erythrobacter sp. TaxID=1042 RepID=UPI0025BC9C1E|nr:hypothetical protein [Erythrobacter sp.]